MSLISAKASQHKGLSRAARAATCATAGRPFHGQRAKDIGAAWREIMGKHYPAMALVEVVRLVEREAKVEIDATAVVPE